MSAPPNLSPKAQAASRRPSPRPNGKRSPPPKTTEGSTLRYVIGGAAALLAVGGLYVIGRELTKPTKKKRKKLSAPIVKTTGTAGAATKSPRPAGDYYEKIVKRGKDAPVGITLCPGESRTPGAFVASSKANLELGLEIGSRVYEVAAKRVGESGFKHVVTMVSKLPPNGTLVFRKDPELNRKWKKAEQLKNEGNSLFSRKQLAESITKYSEAIHYHPTNKIYYSNKVLALLQKAKVAGAGDKTAIFNEALADCRTMRELDVFENFQKGHHVRGVVLLEMGHYSLARSAFQTVLKIDPTNKKALARLNDCKAALKTKLEEEALKEEDEKMEVPPTKSNAPGGGPEGPEGKRPEDNSASASPPPTSAAMKAVNPNEAVRSQVVREVIDKAIGNAVQKTLVSAAPIVGNGEQ